MNFKLYLTGKLRINKDSLYPKTDTVDVTLEDSSRVSYNWTGISWLGKTFNIEKHCRGSVPLLFFLLSNFFRCRKVK